MKRSGILNSELSHAIASMGHGDVMMIVDAGFPIPKESWRIDLALVPGFPSLEQLYQAIAPELIVEKIMFASEVRDLNHPLYATLKVWFDERDFQPVSYEETVGDLARRAKVIVRSGALDPWGNIALACGVDYRAYFNNPAVEVPPRFRVLIDREPFVPGRGVGRPAAH